MKNQNTIIDRVRHRRRTQCRRCDPRRLLRPDKIVDRRGLRGSLSLALAISLPDSAWKPRLLNMTFAAVVFSIIVQGLTIQRMFTREQLLGLLG